MNKTIYFAYGVVRLIRRFRRKLKIISLRLRGVDVDSSAIIDPAAVLEPAGGKIKIGARTFIDRGVIIRPLGGHVVIGDDCSVNAYCVLLGGGGIRIDNDTRVAAHTVIVASNHNFGNVNQAIKDQGLTQKGISVERDVWIGAGARILDDVVLGTGCVVGAGAVVTRSVEPFVVVAGVPAKKIASR